MKVVFVYRGFESLGIEYVSAALKAAGHSTSLVYEPALFDSYFVKQSFLNRLFSFEKSVIKKIIQESPELIAFSVVTEDYSWACRIARQVKEHNNKIKIIFGGPHPTAVPDIIIRKEFVDYVCVGEGEVAMVKLVEALKNGVDETAINGIWCKKGKQIFENKAVALIEDLDSLSFPDKNLFYQEYDGFRRGFYSIVTTRGCVFNCSYCQNNFLHKLYDKQGKKFLRRRSVENVIQELKLAKSKYKIRMISFYDDIFIHDKKWLREFADIFKTEIDIPNFCFVHPELVDGESAEILKSMHCEVVAIGFETFNENIRREMLNRHYSNNQFANAVKLLKRNSIFVSASSICGIPGQTEEELTSGILFLKNLKVDHVHMLWLRYYPGNEIVAKGFENKVLSKEHIKQINEAEQILSGYDFNRKFRKIAHLILLSPHLPKSWVGFIAKKKLYRFLPIIVFSRYHFVFTEFFVLLVFSLRKVLGGVETWKYSGARGKILYYLHYMKNKILAKFIEVQKKDTV